MSEQFPIPSVVKDKIQELVNKAPDLSDMQLHSLILLQMFEEQWNVACKLVEGSVTDYYVRSSVYTLYPATEGHSVEDVEGIGICTLNKGFMCNLYYYDLVEHSWIDIWNLNQVALDIGGTQDNFQAAYDWLKNSPGLY